MFDSDPRDRTATPEIDLISAVVALAVEDLDSTNETDRYESFQFFLQEKGEWADTRRLYFSVLGIDEKRALFALRKKLRDPPERPNKKWTFHEVFDVLPTIPFKGTDVAKVVGLRYGQITGRLQHLLNMELITRLDRGLYIRTDCYAAWRAAELNALALPEDEEEAVAA